MSSYAEPTRLLLRGSQEEDQYLASLHAKYRKSSFCLEYSRLVIARREDTCKLIAERLVVDKKIVAPSTGDIASLLNILDILQRSIVYTLLANDFGEGISTELQAARDIYATVSGTMAAALPFYVLIPVVLGLLKDELLPLVDEVLESDGDPAVQAEVRQSLLSIFDRLQAFAAVEDCDNKSPNAEQALTQGSSLPVSSFFSSSYLRRAPEQSLLIIVLFVVTGLSLFSVKYCIVSGLIGAMLCCLLRVSTPISDFHDLSD